MHAVYDKFKRYLLPDASPPRPLSHVWDLRATNYYTTALTGTGMTPLTASQISTQSFKAEAQVLRAQSAAAEAQSQTLKRDKVVWRKDYLRSKKGNVLRKARNDSREQKGGSKKSANKAPQVQGEMDRLDILSPL
ncbi:MAG: hypothetical protein ASARMPRED_003669 [Alectoria sarmentosa]|nr:MAG: hypothetical protein ASARMPRED_003669 [Alectoria sarmentosa]